MLTSLHIMPYSNFRGFDGRGYFYTVLIHIRRRYLYENIYRIIPKFKSKISRFFFYK